MVAIGQPELWQSRLLPLDGYDSGAAADRLLADASLSSGAQVWRRGWLAGTTATLRNDRGPIRLAVRAGGLLDGGAQPVVLAAGIEGSEEL